MRPIRSIPKQKKPIKEKPKLIAVDYDGCIHNYQKPVPGRRMGPPMEGTKEALTQLKSKGYEIVIFTVWGGTFEGKSVIEKYMNYYHLPFDSITSIKPNAEYYIDDRGIKFTSWEEVLKQI